MKINIPFLSTQSKAFSFKGKTAVITGAGSGIGQALAIQLAAKGANIAMADISEENLEVTRKRAAHPGTKIEIFKVDVSNRAAIYEFAKTVKCEFGRVDIVINNAGVALSETVEDMNYDDFEWVMDINFWGVVYGTKAFLPYLKDSDESYIVNISSIFGLISIPTQAAYNASKFGLVGFTQLSSSNTERTFRQNLSSICVSPAFLSRCKFL